MNWYPEGRRLPLEGPLPPLSEDDRRFRDLLARELGVDASPHTTSVEKRRSRELVFIRERETTRRHRIRSAALVGLAGIGVFGLLGLVFFTGPSMVTLSVLAVAAVLAQSRHKP